MESVAEPGRSEPVKRSASRAVAHSTRSHGSVGLQIRKKWKIWHAVSCTARTLSSQENPGRFAEKVFCEISRGWNDSCKKVQKTEGSNRRVRGNCLKNPVSEASYAGAGDLPVKTGTTLKHPYMLNAF